MPGTVVWALVALVVVEAAGLVTLALLLKRSRAATESLRQRVDARQMLISGGREAVKTVWQTANVLRTEGFGAVVRNSIEELADWAEVERPDLARLTPGGRVVIMFSDIEDSTALNDRIGDRAWVKLIGRHEKMIRTLVDEHSGHVIKCQGDGFMIAFANPAEAVVCGTAVQHAQNGMRMRDRKFRVRIGIHMGKSVRRGDDLFGRNVAMAARVADQADGGEVLVSESVHDAVDDDVAFEEPREVELKGFRGTHRLYPVDLAA